MSKKKTYSKPKNTRKVRKRRSDGVVQSYHTVPKQVQKQVIENKLEEYQKELKQKGKVRIPQVGILRLNVKKAKPARWGTNPFTGEKQKFKAKPKSKVVKFTAAKQLKEAIQ